MITESVLRAAEQAVAARFDMRDDALGKELGQIVAMVARDTYGQDDGRLGVKVRLLCERDLLERSALAWAALRKAHHEYEGCQRPGLRRALHGQLAAYMKDGALRLASSLRSRSEDLAPVFSGRSAIDAAWIARQRRSATERRAQSIEDYVSQLPRGNVVRSFIKR